MTDELSKLDDLIETSTIIAGACSCEQIAKEKRLIEKELGRASEPGNITDRELLTALEIKLTHTAEQLKYYKLRCIQLEQSVFNAIYQLCMGQTEPESKFCDGENTHGESDKSCEKCRQDASEDNSKSDTEESSSSSKEELQEVKILGGGLISAPIFGLKS